MTDYEPHVAAHPDVLEMTDEECAVEAALAMGWRRAWGDGLWTDADESRCIGVNAWRPTHDPAQAAELEIYTAGEVSGGVTVTTTGDGLSCAEVFVGGDRRPLIRPVADLPKPAATTRACLAALRRHRGLA